MINTLTSKEVADALKLPERTVKRMIKKSEIPGIIIKGKYRVVEGDFNTYLKTKLLNNKKRTA